MTASAREQALAERAVATFIRSQPPALNRLATFAALPVVLSADLLHLIRINFFQEPPNALDYAAESRLLLSPLCTDIGEGLYEMRPAVRDLLLRQLEADTPRERVEALAALLWRYTERFAIWHDNPRLERAQQLTALAVLAPAQARAWLDRAEGAQPATGAPVDRQWFVAVRAEVERAAGAAAAARPALWRLPAPPVAFVNRSAELETLAAELQPGCRLWVTGEPGVGKSALVATLLQRLDAQGALTTRFPAGVAYLAAPSLDANGVAAWRQQLAAARRRAGTSTALLLALDGIDAAQITAYRELLVDMADLDAVVLIGRPSADDPDDAFTVAYAVHPLPAAASADLLRDELRARLVPDGTLDAAQIDAVAAGADGLPQAIAAAAQLVAAYATDPTPLAAAVALLSQRRPAYPEIADTLFGRLAPPSADLLAVLGRLQRPATREQLAMWLGRPVTDVIIYLDGIAPFVLRDGEQVVVGHDAVRHAVRTSLPFTEDTARTLLRNLADAVETAQARQASAPVAADLLSIVLFSSGLAGALPTSVTYTELTQALRRQAPLSAEQQAELARYLAAVRQIAGAASADPSATPTPESEVPGLLYQRALNHMADPDAQRIARFAPVLRFLTPELVQQVLAEPCGVEVATTTDAAALFDRLRAEQPLFERDVDGRLIVRPDIRRAILPYLAQDVPETVDRVRRQAIAHFSAREDPAARAEEIYHRLMLDEDPAAVAARWDDRWRVELAAGLAPALDELPSRSRAFLADRLGDGKRKPAPGGPFGSLLRDLRQRAGLSQARLGALVDVHRRTVSSWETEGRAPNRATIDRLAQVLDCSADERRRLLTAAGFETVDEPPITARVESVPEAADPAATFGQLLRAMRRRAGLTQAELARRIDRTSGTIGRWERDEAVPSTSAWAEDIDALVRALDGTADERARLMALAAPPPDHPNASRDDAALEFEASRLDATIDAARRAFEQTGNATETVAMLEAAREAAEIYGYTSGAVRALQAAGDIHRQQGDTSAALTSYEQALALDRSPETRVDIWRAIGEMSLDIGDTDLARTVFASAMNAYAKLGDARNEAIMSCRIATAIAEDGGFEEAYIRLESALGTFGDLGLDADAAAALLQLGNLFGQADRPEEALSYLDEARTMYEKVGRPAGVARAERARAARLRRLGREDEARAALQRVAELAPDASASDDELRRTAADPSNTAPTTADTVSNIVQQLAAYESALRTGTEPAADDTQIQSLVEAVEAALPSVSDATERLQAELALARALAGRFLPAAPPVVPGWEIAARMEPAREPAGDFYDFIPLPDGRLGIVVADAADKGITATLFVALCRTLLRAFAAASASPAKVIAATNRRVMRNASADLFATLVFGALDATTGQFEYVNAGHNPPLRVSATPGTPAQALERTGLPIGIVEDTTWTAGTLTLAPGERLALFTDGVPEAMDKASDLFGDTRLEKVLGESAGSSADATCQAVFSAVAAFVQDTPQFDDMTLVIVKREAAPG